MRSERPARLLSLPLCLSLSLSLLAAAAAVPRQPALGSGSRVRIPPLDQGCPEPCRCAPVQLTAVFGVMLFVRQVVMNCSAAALTALPGPVFYEVYALLLAHNNLTSLGPHAFAADMQVSDLRELDLRDNAIHSIHEDALKGLHSLTSIALDRNNIQTLPPHLFEDCPDIEYVSLSENPLVLPATGPFFSAPSLSIIDISKCGLTSLPDDTFSEMPMLHIIYLSDNPQIGRTNTKALSQLEQLHGLTLMRNERMSLEGPYELSVRELGASGACQVLEQPLAPHLTKLSAQGCGLTQLPSIMMHAWSNIEMLLLGKNAFTTWDTVANMPHLSVLGLDLNNITRLEPSTFSNLHSLGLLNLSGNALQVPERGPLLESDTLHSLDLFNCSLRSLSEDAFASLPKLVAIDLSLNSLEKLPPKLFHNLTQLQQVFLADNRLQSLPADLFVNNQHLRRLHLSGNPLLLSAENSVLPNAPSVLLLELDRMKLSKLQPSWFKNLPQITNLSLADNELTTISVSSISNLKNLQQIRLTGNKLQCNAALLPFYEWTELNAVHVVAKCAEPRGNWQLMEHLHFEEEAEKHEHEKQTMSTTPTSSTSRSTIAVASVPQSTVRQISEVVPSAPSKAEFSQHAVQAASVGGSSNDGNKSSSSGTGSLWVVLLVGVLVGGIAGAVLTALFVRRINCPARASNFLHVRLRDTASLAEDYGDEERLGSSG